MTAPGVHVRYLRRGVVGDILNAEEDVPLIQDDRLTEAGALYLSSLEEAHDD